MENVVQIVKILTLPITAWLILISSLLCTDSDEAIIYTKHLDLPHY